MMRSWRGFASTSRKHKACVGWGRYGDGLSPALETRGPFCRADNLQTVTGWGIA